MKKTVLIDSCYWFGLYDENDSYHEESKVIADLITNCDILIPYPSLFEVLNSTFIRKKAWLNSFEELMSSDRVKLIYDEKYRDEALENTYSIYRVISPQISLVDSIIREIIKDVNVKIDYVITYNEKDFKDICDIRKIDILSE